ncbi:hypothetical protein [Pseudoalteromonas sp. C2R02]|uniref:hypothetical protein n=1 Tax=Pseudoalteromonas sp. C2R02 TaxID=2841565 RepID=UPI001C0A181C|nr:hypothetical protein [Pseudoalteromonas sp. C2R02]
MNKKISSHATVACLLFAILFIVLLAIAKYLILAQESDINNKQYLTIYNDVSLTEGVRGERAEPNECSP